MQTLVSLTDTVPGSFREFNSTSMAPSAAQSFSPAVRRAASVSAGDRPFPNAALDTLHHGVFPIAIDHWSIALKKSADGPGSEGNHAGAADGGQAGNGCRSAMAKDTFEA
jgi:hypothetical protein